MKHHRNSQKRIIFKNAIYFVTVKTHNNFPFFRERIFCDLFIENLRLCKELKQFQLYGWVLLHEHFHLLIQPNDHFDISVVMFSIKKQFSHNCNVAMGFNKPFTPSESDQSTEGDQSTPSESDQSIVRLRIKWFNKNIIQLKSKFFQKYPSKHPYSKFRWQRSSHDHYIRNEKDFDHHMGYMAWNPEKHHLPNDWKYVFTNEKYNNLLNEI